VNLLRVVRPAGGASPRDLDAVRTGLAALGRPVPEGALDLSSHVAQGAVGAGTHMSRTGFGPLLVVPPVRRVRASRLAGAPGRALAAPLDAGVAFASDVRSLWASGLVPRRFDPVGIAGVLWRGAATDARLPSAGVRALRPGETLEVDAAVRVPLAASALPSSPPVSSTAAEAERSLVHAVAEAVLPGKTPVVLLSSGAGGVALGLALLEARGRDVDAVTVGGFDPDLDEAARGAREAATLGVRHHAIDLGAVDPEEALASCLASTDFPSVDALMTWCFLSALAREGIPSVLSGVGARALFGRSLVFRSWRRAAWLARLFPPLGRAKPGGDPLDVRAQRRRELRAFSGIPVNFAHAHASVLPAATREAVSTVGRRPADGVVPAPGTPEEVLGDVERLGLLVDRRLRDVDAAGEALGVDVRFPFLETPVVEAVRGLPPRLRFGRPGSWGWLGARLASRQALPPKGRRAGFPRRLDEWLRGPLSSWLDGALQRDRVAAQGVLVPGTVEDALKNYRARAGGWTAERILVLALVTDWIGRHGLARSEPA
jgi:asparagine synthase (glutamine-hydrolysing)